MCFSFLCIFCTKCMKLMYDGLAVLVCLDGSLQDFNFEVFLCYLKDIFGTLSLQ